MDKVNSEAAAGLQPVLLRDVIDWAAFSEDVLRFESRPEEPRRPIPMNLMIVLLSVIVDVSEALDVIKKACSTGRPSTTTTSTSPCGVRIRRSRRSPTPPCATR